jgi:hypothetical protein
MGFMRKLLVFGLIVGIAAVLYPLFITPEFELPKVEDQWFGKTKLKSKSYFKFSIIKNYFEIVYHSIQKESQYLKTRLVSISLRLMSRM